MLFRWARQVRELGERPGSRMQSQIATFCNERRVEWISDDLAPLDSKPKVSEEVTDTYLADLAAKHGFKFGTLDGGIKHPTAEVIG